MLPSESKRQAGKAKEGERDGGRMFRLPKMEREDGAQGVEIVLLQERRHALKSHQLPSVTCSIFSSIHFSDLMSILSHNRFYSSYIEFYALGNVLSAILLRCNLR